jgi:Zn ribbon nucleic-acid-binding protein
MDTVCKHPKVRVVAREEDVEFVECQECGEVFDSNEFRDMEIEETRDEDEDEEAAPGRRQKQRAKS